MPNVKTNIEIGHRAYSECLKHYGTVARATTCLGMSRTAMFPWYAEGVAPSARLLARMARQGVDVLYILTGKRTTK